MVSIGILKFTHILVCCYSNEINQQNRSQILVLGQVKSLEEIRLKSGVEEKSYTMLQRFKLWLYSSRKEASGGSFEKQSSIEMVKKPSNTSLSMKSSSSMKI